jgi:hypothetical protein
MKIAAIKHAFIKNGPTILLAGGIVAMAAGAATAVIAGIKTHDDIQRHKRLSEDYVELDTDAYDALQGAVAESEEEHDELLMIHQDIADRAELLKQDLKDIRIAAVKRWVPPVLLFVGGGTAVVFGHRILLARYAALLASYVALAAEYDSYRGFISNEYGTEVDAKALTHAREDVQKQIADGTLKANPAALFSETVDDRLNWFNAQNGLMTLMHLNRLEGDLNLCLRANGYLTYNDVRKRLGLKCNNAGCTALWLWNEDYQDVVHFGIDEYLEEAKKNPGFYATPQLTLRFNCRPDAATGNPFAKVGKKEKVPA